MPEEVSLPEQDTGELERETPEEPQEQTEGQALEDSLEETAETETEDESAETEEASPESPFAGKGLDEIAADPEVARLLKDREAKLQESYRQKEEAAKVRAQRDAEQRTYAANRERASRASLAAVQQQLQAVVKKAVENGDDVDAQSVGLVAETVASSVNQYYHDSTAELMGHWVAKANPEYRVPQEIRDAFVTAQRAYSIPGAVDAFARTVWDMAGLTLREQLEKEIRAELEGDSKLADRKASSEKRKTQPKPSRLDGGAPPSGRSRRDIIADPRASTEDKLKAFKEEYGVELSV